jgi:hypothetical protein
MTEAELNLLGGEEFEEVMRAALRGGHWEAEGLPRLSVLEGKITGGNHGFDGIGFRRRGDLVDLYKLEFKQLAEGSSHVVELSTTNMGIQGGRDWAHANVGKLLASDDPVAHETLDALTARLRRYFGNRYSDELLLEAFQHQIARSPLIVAARAHADLSKLIAQMRGIAKVLGRGNVLLIRVRGRR